MTRGNENGLRKGPWSKEEDDKLRAYILRYGHWNWREIPRFAGVSRCGKSCRLRWMNYLRPDIKHGNFMKNEEDLIIEIHNKIGNKWAKIAAELPGRSDNEIKNYWHTHLKKRAKKDQNEPKNMHHETKNYNQESCINSVIMGSSDFGDQNELEAVWASLSSSSSSLSASSSVEPTSLIFGASDSSISSGQSIQLQTYVNEYDDGSFWEDPFFADYDEILKSIDEYASDSNVVDNVILPSGSCQDNEGFMWSSMDDLFSQYDGQYMI